MPIPAPLFSLTAPLHPIDPVRFWIEAPRAAFQALERSKVMRIEQEYGPDELQMLALAYGCSRVGAEHWPAMHALFERHLPPGAIVLWEAPADSLAGIRKLVLPLADYMNLALALGSDEAWDRGALLMREVNPRLLEWMEACAPSCVSVAGRVALEPPPLVDAYFTHWAEVNLAMTQPAQSLPKGEIARLEGEYRARLAGGSDAASDRQLAERLQAAARGAVRAPLWTYHAAAMQPGPFSRHPERGERDDPRRGGRNRARWESRGDRRDPTPEEVSRESGQLIASVSFGLVLSLVGGIAGTFLTAVGAAFQIKERADDQRSSREQQDQSRRESLAQRRAEEQRQRAEHAEAQAKAAERRAQDADRRATEADRRAAAAERRAAEAERKAADQMEKNRQREAAARARENERLDAEQNAKQERERQRQRKRDEESDGVVKRGTDLGCVSPYAEPDFGVGFDEEAFQEEIRIRMNWNARYADPEADTGSWQSVIEQARLRYLSLINLRPGDDFLVHRDPAAIVAEAIAAAERITTPPKPGREGG